MVMVCMMYVFLGSMVNSQRSTVNGQRDGGDGGVNGQWSMVNGQRDGGDGESMVNGQRSMVNGQWSMVKETKGRRGRS